VQRPAVPVLGPLAQQIIAAEFEVALLGEQVLGLEEEIFEARARTAAAQFVWQAAADEVARLRTTANSAASDAYREATGLRPYGEFGSDLRDLSILLPRSEEPATGSEAAARELGWAEADERTKLLAYNAALATELDLTGRHGALQSLHLQRGAALEDLKRRNADQLARIAAEREAFEQSRAGEYGKQGPVIDGMMAHPNALKAVQFAIAQRGKPYEWGAEGPNTYDCSGLMWASYRPYRLLNRVAKDQYRQTSTDPIALTKLLPGDLLFFSNSPSGGWTTISHVAMYIGDGRMMHTATRGDVAKIETVWWSRIYGATRVLPAVPAPTQAPPKPTSPAPGQTTTRPPTSAPTSTAPTSGPTSSPTGEPTAPQTAEPSEPPPSTEPTADPTPSPTPGPG
jgi:cell wall-associated NlpC family hydrolase